MTKDGSFLKAFTTEVATSLLNDHDGNYDEQRFGPIAVTASAGDSPIITFVKKLFRGKGYIHVLEARAIMQSAYGYVAPVLTRLDALYDRLADDESKRLLVQLMAFRALGHHRIKLLFNSPELRNGIQKIEASSSGSDFLATGFKNVRLNRTDLGVIGIPGSLYFVPVGIYITFQAQQYRCGSSPFPVEVCAGDYVIDGGGCWGDTAVYFANKAGDSGRVFTFEFVAANLEILRKNLALNPVLGARVEIVERALWNNSTESLKYSDGGPGTSVCGGEQKSADKCALTMSIDDLVAEKKLPRLDFIKMDIEGAELPALKGAEQTLRRFKSKLAICVYHKLEDFFDIPDYLESLGLNYRFYLRHFSIHSEETVLFARAD